MQMEMLLGVWGNNHVSQPQEMLIYLLAWLKYPFADSSEPETGLWNEPAGNHVPQKKELTFIF